MGSQAEYQVSELLAQVVALQAEVERLKAEISFLTVDPEALANPLSHRRNCAAWLSEFGHEVNAEDCTCGYRYRIVLQTEQNIRAAWMKRANEAETERDSLREQLRIMQEPVSDKEWNGCFAFTHDPINGSIPRSGLNEFIKRRAAKAKEGE